MMANTSPVTPIDSAASRQQDDAFSSGLPSRGSTSWLSEDKSFAARKEVAVHAVWFRITCNVR